MTGFLIAASALVPGVLSTNPNTAMMWIVIALAGLELTVAVSWAICIDIGERCSGSVSGVMNTVGNLGGAAGAVGVGYLATISGWTSCFVVASAFCLVAALLATRINPARSAIV
jgi:predicted MFS family arabinose efflux permease